MKLTTIGLVAGGLMLVAIPAFSADTMTRVPSTTSPSTAGNGTNLGLPPATPGETTGLPPGTMREQAPVMPSTSGVPADNSALPDSTGGATPSSGGG